MISKTPDGNKEYHFANENIYGNKSKTNLRQCWLPRVLMKFLYRFMMSMTLTTALYPARTLRALGLLLADGASTVGRGKTFWRVGPKKSPLLNGLLAPNIQIFGSKLHIFVPSDQFEPHRSMFSTRKRCLIGPLIWGYQKFYSIPLKKWIFGPKPAKFCRFCAKNSFFWGGME